MWQTLYDLPAWGTFVVIVGATSAGAALVVGTAARLRGAAGRADESGVAMVIHQSLIAGYAVLLAFVTVNVWEGYQSAEAAARAEASALADLARVAQVMTGADHDRLAPALKGYTQALLSIEWPAMQRGREPPLDSPAISSLNKAIFGLDVSTPRQVAIFQHIIRLDERLLDERRLRLSDAAAGIGPAVWWVLILGALLCVGSIYFFGRKTLKHAAAASAVLGLMFGLFFFLIVATDYPFRGGFAIEPTQFQAVLRYLETI